MPSKVPERTGNRNDKPAAPQRGALDNEAETIPALTLPKLGYDQDHLRMVLTGNDPSEDLLKNLSAALGVTSPETANMMVSLALNS